MGIRSGRLHDAVTTAQLSAIDTSNIGKVYDTNGEAMVDVWIGSQAEYDAIDPKDANTLYLIEEAIE
jgi:hypothetical protein